jgi:hypothetical protein
MSRQLTSLQEQLLKIQNPDGPRKKNNISQKHKDSFLFNSKEAAEQSNDTIFELASSGFLELCQLNKQFKKFEATFFSQASKETNRVLLVILYI